jgi:transcriptional regulator with XRE-family HTH domain
MASQPPRQIKDIVGANIRSARLARELTQSQVARHVGVESMAVSRWERGLVRPSDTNLQAVADILGRDPAWFFRDREPQEKAA